LDGVRILETNAGGAIQVSSLSLDSRTAREGTLFFAVRGLGEDRQRFIPDAVKNGCAAVVCEEKPEAAAPYILVENARAAMAVISANFYGNPAKKLKIIGVTGTNGKTTVTNLIKHMIESLTGKPAGLIGTNRNMVGETEIPATGTTPESPELHALFAKMTVEGCEYCVMEVSSHSLAVNRVDGIRFHVGVFTNLTQDHLNYHETMDNYAQAKARLFTQCDYGVVNLDDKYAAAVMSGAVCPIKTFAAQDDGADIVAKRVKLYPSMVRFSVLTTGSILEAQLNIPGLFSVYNALAAILAVRLCGFALEETVRALSSCGGVLGRAEVVPTGEDFMVIIDYAHTPDALENILTALRGGGAKRIVTLFGCGGDRDAAKRPIMGEIAGRLSDEVIVTSDNPRTEQPEAIIADIVAGMTESAAPYTVIPSRREAIICAVGNAQVGDTILLAGKGHETYQIIGREAFRFDEREVVAEAIALRAGRICAGTV
jgi:UDP-N-acetylmuramoyl-L-alanyl-D-glutamate--2,6-diaminopimelate ligase